MAGDADIASHLSVIFDERLSSKSGYVYKSNKVDEIVKEWELRTNSSFALWKVDDNFGSIGKSGGPNKPHSVLFWRNCEKEQRNTSPINLYHIKSLF